MYVIRGSVGGRLRLIFPHPPEDFLKKSGAFAGVFRCSLDGAVSRWRALSIMGPLDSMASHDMVSRLYASSIACSLALAIEQAVAADVIRGRHSSMCTPLPPECVQAGRGTTTWTRDGIVLGVCKALAKHCCHLQ